MSNATSKDLGDTFAPDWPHIEFLAINGFAGSFVDEATDMPPRAGVNYVSLAAALVSPFSRGNVTINSTDTSKNPLISPNWLLDPRDQEIAVAGYRMARAAFNTSSMAPIVEGPEGFPGANVSSYDQILSAFQKNSITVYHAAATNAMGRANDSMAVVDSKCRVFGVQGLRVVDASAFPFLPPGHPQATVCECMRLVPAGRLKLMNRTDALAEKIADDIMKGR